jgi:hypothetical protein
MLFYLFIVQLTSITLAMFVAIRWPLYLIFNPTTLLKVYGCVFLNFFNFLIMIEVVPN